MHFLGYRESWKSVAKSSAKDVGVDEEQKTLVPPSSGSAPKWDSRESHCSRGRDFSERHAVSRGPVNVEDRRRAGLGARARPDADGRAQTAQVPGA